MRTCHKILISICLNFNLSQLLSLLYGHTTFSSPQLHSFYTVPSVLWLALCHASNFCNHSAPTFYIQSQCEPQSPFSPQQSTHFTDLLFTMAFLMFLVLKACSCAAIIIPSVSFFNPLRLSHYQDFEPLTSSVATK